MCITTIYKILFFAGLAALTVVGCSRNDYYDQSNFGAGTSGISSSEAASSGSADQIAKLEQTKDCLGCHDQDYQTFAKNRLAKIQEKHKSETARSFADYWTNPHRSAHGTNIPCLTCHIINKDLTVVESNPADGQTRCSNKVVPDSIACQTCHGRDYMQPNNNVMTLDAQMTGGDIVRFPLENWEHKDLYSDFYNPEVLK